MNVYQAPVAVQRPPVLPSPSKIVNEAVNAPKNYKQNNFPDSHLENNNIIATKHIVNTIVQKAAQNNVNIGENKFQSNRNLNNQNLNIRHPVQNNNFKRPPVQNNNFQRRPVQNNNFQRPTVQNNNFQRPPVQNDNFQRPPVQNNNFQRPTVQNNNFQRPTVQNNNFQRPPVQNNFQRPPVQNNILRPIAQILAKPTPQAPQVKILSKKAVSEEDDLWS
jgi:hypothetical protein